MSAYLGLSFLRESVHTAVLDFNGGKIESQFEERPAQKLPLFPDLDSHLILGMFREANAETACQHLFKAVRDRKLGAISDEAAQDRSFKSTCLVHPYGLSPVARRSLIAALDGTQPLPARSQFSRLRGASAEVSTNRGVCCAIEAPFALMLYLAGHSRLNQPCTVVTITQGVCGPEFLLIDTDFRNGNFRVRNAFETDSAQGFVNEAMNVVSGKILVAAESEFIELANSYFSHNLVERVTERDIAWGAARFAALSNDEPFSEANRFQFSAVAPYSIGIVGRGDDGYYWCPIIERGDSFDGSPRSIVISQGELPEQLLMAYAAIDDRVAGTWLSESEFESCRYFTHVPIDKSDGDGGKSITISIQSHSGCTGYRWSDPLIAASVS